MAGAESMTPERWDEIAKKAAVKRGGRKLLLRRDRLDVIFFETHQEHSIFRHCVPYGLVFSVVLVLLKHRVLIEFEKLI